MQLRENVKLFLFFVTAVATSVAAYATYQIYLDQTELPTLMLESFKIVGTQEVGVQETSSLSLKKVNSKEGFDDYELPLQVSNRGNKDVDDIHLIIDVEGGTLIVPTDWNTGTYADNVRYHKSISHLTPMTFQKLPDVKIHVKSTIHEVKLKWSILAKRTIPPEGILVFRF